MLSAEYDYLIDYGVLLLRVSGTSDRLCTRCLTFPADMINIHIAAYSSMMLCGWM